MTVTHRAHFSQSLKWEWFVLISVCCLYLIAVGLWGAFPSFDEFFFKTAGLNWALKGEYAAPAMRGFLPGPPPIEDLYFAHPPVYTFAYGIWVKLLGYSLITNSLFDASIHILVVIALYTLGRSFLVYLSKNTQVTPPSFLALPAPLLYLPFSKTGRPDELSIAFALFGMSLLVNGVSSRFRVISSGILFGFSAATSIVGAVTLGWWVLFFFLFAQMGWRTKFAHMAYWQSAALFSIALTITPILIKEPEAFRQYWQHIEHTQQVNVLSAWSHILSLFSHHYPAFVSFGLLMSPLLIVTAAICKVGKITIKLWLPIAVGASFFLIVLPGRTWEFWYLLPSTLFAMVMTCYLLIAKGNRLARFAFVPVFSAAYLAILQFPLKDWSILIQLPPEQTAAYNREKLLTHIPPDARVLVSTPWFMLADFVEATSSYARPLLPEDIDFVVVYQGIQLPDSLKPKQDNASHIAPDTFIPLHKNHPEENRTSQTHSKPGFSVEIYVRKGYVYPSNFNSLEL